MQTLQMTEAIVARLKTSLPHLAVEHWPGNTADYRLSHATGAVLVSYRRSTFKHSMDAANVVQPRRVRWLLTVWLRVPAGRGGELDVLDQVRKALVGYCPPGCRKLHAKSEKIVGDTAGQWQALVEVACEALLVEDISLPDVIRLNTVNYKEIQ
ncbi:hypothetical protein HNQ59_000677 [Chitinivorax tropicus]|uniref:Gp37 protein n=1 Tax=Chitinivorax tropicus TaxID=714531 RepID=A0A840MMI4_9PROT|nr:Gp37 family protein [Chitinivorax tropicus]MBB5017413.1 hypothetical protein [Chitinivorax tropicus]